MFPDNPIVPEVDLIFAVSSTAANSKSNYKQMKDIINKVIDQYGILRINYGLITFGSQPAIKIGLADFFKIEASLQGYVQAAPRASGAALHKVLEEAVKAFKSSLRPTAKKVKKIQN